MNTGSWNERKQSDPQDRACARQHAQPRHRGHLPEHLHMVGVQPADLSVGVKLSLVVEDVLPQILDRAESILREWQLLD